MRFMKMTFRRSDIFLIPIMCLIMFFWQYYAIKSSAKEYDKKILDKLEKMSKECREGNHKSCDEYIKLLNASIKQ